MNATTLLQPATFGGRAPLPRLRLATLPVTSAGIFGVGNGTTVPATGCLTTATTIQTMQAPVADGDTIGLRTRRRHPV